MKSSLALIAGLVFLTLASAGTAFAQLNNGQQNAVVAVHAQAHDTKGINCSNLDPNLYCSGFTTHWPVGVGADVYFVVANADSALGVSGVSFGVDYGDTPGVTADGQGVDVFAYETCGQQAYPNGIDPGDPSTNFPAAGGGIRLVWDRSIDCQRHELPYFGVHAVACVFYVYAYSPDQLIVDMNRNEPTGPEFRITDCAGPSDSDMGWSSQAGIVGFGGGGDNPGWSHDWDPPYMLGASGMGNANLVTIQFSEGGYGGSTSYYSVYPTAEPSAPLTVTRVSISGPQVTLTLGSNLTTGVSYTVEVSQVQDAWGNEIRANSAMTFTAANDVPAVETTWGKLKTQYR